MIQPFQTLIRTGDLAKVLGVSSNTLIAWTNKNPSLRACLFKRSYYKVQALRDRGILTTPVAPPAAGIEIPPPIEGLSNVG